VLTRVFGNAKVGMPNAELWELASRLTPKHGSAHGDQSGNDGARRAGLYGEEAEMSAMSGEPPLCSSSVRGPEFVTSVSRIRMIRRAPSAVCILSPLGIIAVPGRAYTIAPAAALPHPAANHIDTGSRGIEHAERPSETV